MEIKFVDSENRFHILKNNVIVGYAVSRDGEICSVLKKNVFKHDGEKFHADELALRSFYK